MGDLQKFQDTTPKMFSPAGIIQPTPRLITGQAPYHQANRNALSLLRCSEPVRVRSASCYTFEHHQLFNFFRADEDLYIVNVIPRPTSAAC